tara:strand:- start:315 stop:563 length:249 start_codon:yes stop_codon:yes gene_type:complete
MPKKNSPRRKPPRTFLTRLSAEPTKTTKAAWKNSHWATKGLVILAGVGFTGIGAAEVVGWGRVGRAVSPIVNWGARMRTKLG